MKRGDRVEMDIESLSARGDGIGSCEGVELHVPGTVPGDRVEVILQRKRRGRFEGREVGVLSPAMKRREPICRHFGECGGCRWQHLAYDDQLTLKSEMVSGPLKGAGIDPASIEPIVPSRRETLYRNKMEFSFATGPEGDLRLGLHVSGRYNRVFDLTRCHLQSDVSNRIVAAVRSQARARDLSAYDLRSHEGLLRFLVIREGKFTEQVLVNLVVAEFPRDDVLNLAQQVCAEIPQITSFVVTLHTGKAQVARGQQEFAIVGSGDIVERCGELTYEISAQSFFQTNSYQVEVLYDLVADLAKPLQGRQVLDLYCGTGGIGLYLANLGAEVVGIEQEEAIVDARRNAAVNQLVTAKFRAGTVEELLPDLDLGSFDLVIADPPRAGLHKDALAALGVVVVPSLIYVSCNPVTLAADLVNLGRSGYQVQSVRPLDMFPQTAHSEVVVALVGT